MVHITYMHVCIIKLFSSLQFPGEWRVCHTLQLKHPVDSLCWNREGTQLLVGGKDVSLWTLELPPQVFATEVLPEREMGDIGDNGSGQLGVWSEVWRCEVAVPVVHLKLSPDSLLFATAGEVSNTQFCNEHLQIFICKRLFTNVFYGQKFPTLRQILHMYIVHLLVDCCLAMNVL